jgi:hypothetical protein
MLHAHDAPREVGALWPFARGAQLFHGFRIRGAYMRVHGAQRPFYDVLPLSYDAPQLFYSYSPL